MFAFGYEGPTYHDDESAVLLLIWVWRDVFSWDTFVAVVDDVLHEPRWSHHAPALLAYNLP